MRSAGGRGSKLEVLRERQGLSEADKRRLAALNRAIAHGRADCKAGKVKPAEEVFARLEARYRRMAKAHE